MTATKKIIFLITLLTCWHVTHAQNNAAKPRVFSIAANTLLANKTKVKANDADVFPAYKELIKDAGDALHFGPVSVMEKKNFPPSGDKHDYMSLAPYHWPDPTKPGGLPYIRRDGETNPEVKEYKDKEYMPDLCSNVQTLALGYFFSGDERYAAHAARLLKVWFLDTATRMNPNLNFAQAIKGENTGRGAGIIDGRHFIKLIDAIGLIQSSRSWDNVAHKGMQAWFAGFLNWMQTSRNGLDENNTKNNHGVWYDALRLSISLFIDSTDLSKKIISHVQDRLDKQMDNTGRFPLEMERTTSLHYSVFIMDAFLNIAQMAQYTGIDLWHYISPSGKSLRKGVDALLPYISKQKKWDGPQIKEFDFEEGYQLLEAGYLKFGCINCRETIRSIAGSKEKKLLINLLY